MTEREFIILRNYELAQVILEAKNRLKSNPERAELLLASAQNVWMFLNPKRPLMERILDPNEN